VSMLLGAGAGANLNKTDCHGMTPLMWSVAAGGADVEVVKLML